MANTTQIPIDLAKMAAQPSVIRMSAVDPHATLTAPIGPAPKTAPIMSANPAEEVPHMALTPPVVSGPASLPGILARTQDQLMSLQQKDDDPYGSADNHPGFLGKFLHGLNVATGGVNRRHFQEDNLENQIAANEGLQSKIGDENAVADEDEAKANDLKNPPAPKQSQERPYTLPTDQGELEWTADGWKPIQVNGETVNPPEKPRAEHPFQRVAGTAAGEKGTIYANYDPIHGVYLDQTGKVIPNFQPADKSMKGAYGGFGPAFLAYHLLNSAYSENPALLPVIAPMIAKMFASAGDPQQADNVAQAISQIPAGQPHDSQGSAIGLRMPESPTGATRSRAQFAQSVVPTIDEAQKEISALGDDETGPLRGRFLELYQGKFGANDPRYAMLRTQLHNIATAWMRLHGNSEKTMKDFLNTLRTAQTPQDLSAALGSIRQQAQDYVKEGSGRPDQLGVQENQGRAAKFSVQAGGKTWTFPNQEALDNFKKAAGIQ